MIVGTQLGPGLLKPIIRGLFKLMRQQLESLYSGGWYCRIGIPHQSCDFLVKDRGPVWQQITVHYFASVLKSQYLALILISNSCDLFSLSLPVYVSQFHKIAESTYPLV
jgi:hypothetical protein